MNLLKKNFETYVELKNKFSKNEELIDFLDMCIIVSSETDREDAIRGINFIKSILSKGE